MFLRRKERKNAAGESNATTREPASANGWDDHQCNVLLLAPPWKMITAGYGGSNVASESGWPGQLLVVHGR